MQLAPSDKPGIGTPNVCRIRITLSISTTAVPTTAAMRVSRPLANSPMMSRRCVKISSAIIGIGRAMLSTTWLMTSALVALTPSADDDEGRHHGDKPPEPDRNAEADEALHDHLAGHGADRRAGHARSNQRDRKTAAAAGAEQRRQRVVGGLDFGDVTDVRREKRADAIITIAMLTRPAIASATTTSCWRSAAPCAARRRCALACGAWVRPECR